MAFEVELTDEFKAWFEDELSAPEQKSVARAIDQLEDLGSTLRYPLSSGISGSRIGHMRELRIQHQGRPYRVLYAFDPRRVAILLLGGDKTGDNHWYDKMVPRAEALYARHLRIIEDERQDTL